jgi:hypothetical protein
VRWPNLLLATLGASLAAAVAAAERVTRPEADLCFDTLKLAPDPQPSVDGEPCWRWTVGRYCGAVNSNPSGLCDRHRNELRDHP